MKKKILIVIANYYKDVSEALLKSAKEELNKFAKIKIIEVPGVFEIPITISKNIKMDFINLSIFYNHDV